MAFIGGRCKLVLSMRANSAAEATLREIPDELRDAALELMAAHELGHCRRHLDGAWHGIPAGFAPATPEHLSPELKKAYADMQATRREEAFGDLVGLAWVQLKRPALYGRMHAWLVAERRKGPDPRQPSRHARVARTGARRRAVARRHRLRRALRVVGARSRQRSLSRRPARRRTSPRAWAATSAGKASALEEPGRERSAVAPHRRHFEHHVARRAVRIQHHGRTVDRMAVGHE